MGFLVGRFIGGPVGVELICKLCIGVLDEPFVLSGCDHVFCYNCILDYMREYAYKCPTCEEATCFENLRPASRLVKAMIQKLQLHCDYQIYGCQEIVTIEKLTDHVRECEYNPFNLIPCAAGCGTRLRRSEIADHNCIREFELKLSSMTRTLLDISNVVSSQRVELRTQHEELVGLKELYMACKARNERFYIDGDVVFDASEMADIERWAAVLLRVKIKRWDALLPKPDTIVKREVQNALRDSKCPEVILENLIENSEEVYWPAAMRSAEERQQHEAQLNNLVCRRVPGQPAVVVLSIDNSHLCGDFKKAPGYILIFYSEIEFLSYEPF